MDRLQQRWKVQSAFQVIVILIVFACTGTTVALLAKPLLHWIFAPQPVPWWAKIVYYILILPIYNIFLLLYGFLLGQFHFFWEFEKRFFNRILRKNKTTP
ncbi:MAG: prolipoprotein diacylglyceryl transferase [Cyclobacteriaceae bacterium]|nr:prolipoprotein diacylglyceryl transferase [Cyclobacteriaceae bacterium]